MNPESIFTHPLDEAGLLVSIAILACALAVGIFIHLIVFSLLKRGLRDTDRILGQAILGHLPQPLRWLFPLLAVWAVSPILTFPENLIRLLQRLLAPGFVGVVAWIAVSIVFMVRDVVLSRYDLKARDNLKARTVHTQVNVMVKVALVIIAVLGIGTMLLTIEKIRQVGVSILASAGVIGIIVGFAAQRSIATLFAGIQIAITQPIRLDDVVIVEGEWGWIEEVTLTYVVVRIWDLRRLVVPITYFIEKPFQNWTRTSAEILGTVYLYADYTVPVQAIRDELRRIAEGSELWDGKVCGLQVTDAKAQTVELRALVSAEDSSKAWNLRCEVREKLLEFLRNNYPESLPRIRAELERTESPSPGNAG